MSTYVIKWVLNPPSESFYGNRSHKVYLSCGHSYVTFHNVPETGCGVVCCESHDKTCETCQSSYTLRGTGAASIAVTRDIMHSCFGCVLLNMGAKFKLNPTQPQEQGGPDGQEA